MNSFSKEKECRGYLNLILAIDLRWGIQGTHHPKFVTINCHLRDTQKTVNSKEMF